jgi:hypothetical protein
MPPLLPHWHYLTDTSITLPLGLGKDLFDDHIWVVSVGTLADISSDLLSPFVLPAFNKLVSLSNAVIIIYYHLIPT